MIFFVHFRVTTFPEFLKAWKGRGILQKSGKFREFEWSGIYDCDTLGICW